MDRADFMLAEYQSLRTEIEKTKENIFKTISFGILGIPGMYFVSQQFDIKELILAVPIMVIVVGILYLSENHALMRCGRYIRDYIEDEVSNHLGWENWLTEKSDKYRTVDKFLSYGFYIMFVIYYSATVIIAAKFALNKFGLIAGLATASVYIVVGSIFTFFVVKNIKTATDTKDA